jgi:hypothetical protein
VNIRFRAVAALEHPPVANRLVTVAVALRMERDPRRHRVERRVLQGLAALSTLEAEMQVEPFQLAEAGPYLAEAEAEAAGHRLSAVPIAQASRPELVALAQNSGWTRAGLLASVGGNRGGVTVYGRPCT